ncbi:MAG: M20 family metallopeptidase [Rhodospirillales bacterium]
MRRSSTRIDEREGAIDDARILKEIDDGEVAALCADLARIPSFSGEEGPCARFLAGRLRELGFDEVSLQDVEPGRPNVIAVLKGDGGGPSFMFNGHLDIDPLPADYAAPHWRPVVADGKLYGLGVGNMKAGDAAMVMAATALRRSGLPLKGDVIVAGVVGELQGGIGTRHMLERGLVPDLAIVPEPTACNVRTIHAGVLELLIHFSGRTAWIGNRDILDHVDAIAMAAKGVEALGGVRFRHTPRADLPGLPAMVVGGIIGGLTPDYVVWRPAMVADYCTIEVDVRLAPGMTLESTVADLRAALDAVAVNDPDFRYEIDLPPAPYRKPFQAMGLFMPPNDLPPGHRLAQVCRDWHRRLSGTEPGVGVFIPGSYAGADSGHLAAFGTKCLNYGPSDHSRFYNECDLDKLALATRVLALAAAEFVL